MALLDDFRRARRHGSRRRLLRAASWRGWSFGRLIEFLPIIKGKRRAFPERIDPREKKIIYTEQAHYQAQIFFERQKADFRRRTG